MLRHGRIAFTSQEDASRHTFLKDFVFSTIFLSEVHYLIKSADNRYTRNQLMFPPQVGAMLTCLGRHDHVGVSAQVCQHFFKLPKFSHYKLQFHSFNRDNQHHPRFHPGQFYRLREEQLSERLCVRCHQPFSLLFNRCSQLPELCLYLRFINRQNLCTSLPSLSLFVSSCP